MKRNKFPSNYLLPKICFLIQLFSFSTSAFYFSLPSYYSWMFQNSETLQQFFIFYFVSLNILGKPDSCQTAFCILEYFELSVRKFFILHLVRLDMCIVNGGWNISINKVFFLVLVLSPLKVFVGAALSGSRLLPDLYYWPLLWTSVTCHWILFFFWFLEITLKFLFLRELHEKWMTK